MSLSKIVAAVEQSVGCRAIPVKGGWFALVDEVDYQWLSSRKWYLNQTGYAIANGRNIAGRCIDFMHTEILSPPDGFVTDHANHCKLDNRRSNLRLCSETENRFNLPLRADNTTGFKGVYRRGKRWKAQLTAEGKHYFLGSFPTPEEAARAYDTKAVETFGRFASLNFPLVANAG